MNARIPTASLATALAMVGGIGMAQPAYAAGPVVTVTHRAANMTNFNQVLATCSGFPGAICRIERTVEATRTIGVDLDVSRGFVSGKLNLSNDATKRVSVTCGPYTMTTRHRRLVAYPLGTQIFYKITSNGRTSGTLMAFEPHGVSTGCYLYA